jgi:hypothetical protein
MMEVGPIEHLVQPSEQTDANPGEDLDEESIEVRRQIQRGISGERIDEVEVTKHERTVAARRPVGSTQVIRHSSAIRPGSREGPSQAVSPSQQGDGAAAQPLQASVASPERPGLRTTQKAEQLESASGMRTGRDHPVDTETQLPPVRDQEVSPDLLRPTLEEVSFRRPHREEAVLSGGERPPVVQIRIGRIEVRAVEPPVPAPSRKIVEPPRSSLPLDQYLRRRARES